MIMSVSRGSVTTVVELLSLLLSVPVCPHAGGVGLCELVQHLILFDYICVSGSLANRYEPVPLLLDESRSAPFIDVFFFPPSCF